MNIRSIAGVSHRPDALTGNTSHDPVSFGYAQPALPTGKLLQAVIDIGLLAFAFLFILDAAMGAAGPFIR